MIATAWGHDNINYIISTYTVVEHTLMHTRTYIHTYTHINTHINIHTHIQTHTHTTHSHSPAHMGNITFQRGRNEEKGQKHQQTATQSMHTWFNGNCQK